MDKGLSSLFLIWIINLEAPLTTRFDDKLVDIQFGRKPNKWIVDIN
jgi:hypothetical protein